MDVGLLGRRPEHVRRCVVLDRYQRTVSGMGVKRRHTVPCDERKERRCGDRASGSAQPNQHTCILGYE